PATQGLYRVCGGYLVTTAGATGATLQGSMSFYGAGVVHGPVFGSAEPATAVGTSPAGAGQNPCLTILADSGKAISVGYIVGGAPATNPTYTYWYTVEAL